MGFLTPCFEIFDMRFKGEFCIPNQTKKFSFFYKLDMVIVQFQNRIQAFSIRAKMHGYGLILGNSKTVFESPFF